MAENQVTDSVDPIVETLLRQTYLSSNDGPLNDAREVFNRDTVVLLLGLGLTGEEILQFQKHDIGLAKLSSLTISDLDYLGIKSTTKQANIMKCIQKLCKPKDQKPEEGDPDDLFKTEDIQAMENVLKHQKILVKIIPYLQQHLNKCENIFFQSGISANHTFEKVMLSCMQQAGQVNEQLFLYLQELEQSKSDQSKKPWTVLWPHQCKKWWFLALIAGSCISLAVWGSRKSHALPAQWMKTWHLLPYP